MLTFSTDKSVQDRIEQVLLCVVLLVAAYLRFYHLGDISFNNDELSALTRAKHATFSEMIEKGVMIDYHPAGVEAFIYYWIKWLGDEVWIFRLPFVLLSLGSIYFIYRIGKDWFHAAAGLLAAAFFAVLEFPLLYSMLARMYSPGLFFSLVTVFYWTRWMKAALTGDSVSRVDVVGFIVAMALGAHTHYFTVVFLFSVGLTGCFLLPRKHLLGYLLACSLGALSFLLELRVFFTQMETGDLGGWLGRPEKSFLLDFFFHFFNDSKWLLLLLALSFFPWLKGAKYKSISSRFRWAGISWFLFSFLLGYSYSILRHPALQYSTLLFSAPFFMLTLLSFLPETFYTGIRLVLLIFSWLLAGTVSTVFGRNYYETPPFGVFKEVAADLSRWNATYDSDRVTAVVNVINPEYIRYYFRRTTHAPKDVLYKIESSKDLASLRAQIDTSTVGYFAYAWTNNIHPYEIVSIIRSRFPVVVEVRHYYNAETWLFGRGQAPDDALASWQMTYDEGWTALGMVFDSTSVSPPGLIRFTPERDFTESIKAKIADPVDSFQVVYSSVWFRSLDTTSNATLDLKFEKDGQVLLYDNVRLNDFNLNPGKWQQAFLASTVPQHEDSLELKVYVWNSDKSTFDVDNLSAKLFSEVDPYLRK